MEDYELYELNLKKNNKRNEKFLKIFENWLKDQKLVNKTIKKHLNNIDLYINDYLNYYEVTPMEDGVGMVYSFLSDWFIRKCMWSSVASIKETAASIKKFYQCMSEKNYIKNEDYKFLCQEIKNNMDIFIDSFIEYDQYEGEEWEEFI